MPWTLSGISKALTHNECHGLYLDFQRHWHMAFQYSLFQIGGLFLYFLLFWSQYFTFHCKFLAKVALYMCFSYTNVHLFVDVAFMIVLCMCVCVSLLLFACSVGVVFVFASLGMLVILVDASFPIWGIDVQFVVFHVLYVSYRFYCLLMMGAWLIFTKPMMSMFIWVIGCLVT